MSVITSSEVGCRTKSRWWRSLMRSSSAPYCSQRPDSIQSSAGCTTGISSSMAPAAFISSRTMPSILRMTFSPSGM
ncbi:Uncharacterised protein [Bordetella pertussis]|nr:Uncharacterised protein [Bordetella pertussis]CFO65397.1 Uncharacterised protein [Bordetella pertussis]CFP60665.1 Uncharacterised protein [Bordetella pertussis]CFW29671.1 Uncharacterised protein [Bordetella pertussis]CPK68461.1 Uncharacterised protein [Bordetella pertussis]